MNFSLGILDTSIFIAFLVVNLLIGVFFGRGIKTIKEYAVGDRNFSTATIAATIVATWATGSDFFSILSETYTNGLYFIWAVAGDALCLLLVGIFFAPRLAEFLGKISIAEAMGELFGEKVRIVTALAGFIGAAGMIAVQLKVSGVLFEYCFGVSSLYGVIIGGAIVTIYSSFGGIKSVTFTDVIQLFTFGTIIPTLAFVIINSVSSFDTLIATIKTHELFDYKQVFDFTQPKSLSYLYLFFFIAVPGFNPAIFQRIAMSKNTIQVRKAFIIAGFSCMFITMAITWIGIIMLTTKTNIDPNDIVKHILSDYSYNGLRGLTLVGIMALVMSTADSYINSASVLFVHDFCKPLGILRNINELIATRVFALIIGTFALSLSIVSDSLLNLIVVTNTFYLPVVTVPFIMALFGFRSSGKSVLIGMTAGFCTLMFYKIIDAETINSLIPSMLANLIFLVGSHYVLNQPGGWVGIKDDSQIKLLRQTRRIQINHFLESIKNFNIRTILQKNCPNTEGMYAIFGIFCIISVFFSVHTIPKELQLQHDAIMSFIFPTVTFFATGLISYPLWLTSWKNGTAIALYWNATVFYILICSSFMLVLISNFSHLQLMGFMVNLIVIAALMNWKWALLLIISGIIITTNIFRNYLNIDYVSHEFFISQFEITYLLMLISAILVIFLRPKQEQYALSEEKNEHLSGRIEVQESELRQALALKKEFIRNVTHEYNAPMTGILSMAEVAYAYRDNLSKEELADTIDTIYKNALRLNNFDSNISTLAKLSKAGVELHKEKIDLSSLVHERVEICRKLYEDNQDREFIFNIAKGVEVFADRYYLTQTIDNLIINAITYCKKGNIIIELEQDKTKNKVKFTITDEGVGIPRSELYDIFDEFKVSSKTHTPAGGRGVGLAVAKKVIEVHGGKIWADSDGESGASFCFVLSV